MSTFRRRHRETAKAWENLRTDRNSCVVFAMARALADDPADDAEVGEWAPLVEDALDATGRLDATNSWLGSIQGAAKACGIEGEFRLVSPTTLRYRNANAWGNVELSDTSFPTVAQWLRANPDVTEAILGVTGHAGYIRDGVSYALGARMRVTECIVLGRKES